MSKGYIVCVYENINNDEALKNYATKARLAVEKYNGKFLIRGGKNIVTEGKNFVRTVVIEFDSFEKTKNLVIFSFLSSKFFMRGINLFKIK